MRLLFAAGGTGGTVIPAIVVADAVRQKDPTSEIIFVGTSQGFETSLVPQAGYKLELITVAGLKKKSIAQRVRNFARLPSSFVQSWKILSKYSPEVVFGTGGFASGPILFLSALRRIHTAVLEPNTIPGFANRVLAKFVDTVFVAFEEAVSRLPRRKCIFLGNPIRRSILKVKPPTFLGERKTVLIFGGSQGAKRLNDGMVDALKKLGDLKNQIQFIHQTGTVDELKVRQAYREAGYVADVYRFIDDMSEVYEKSDLIVARSGSSVLEIAAVGRPSILVPFPFAADDHQHVNAKVLEKIGAAVLIEDRQCNGEALATKIRELVTSPGKLKEMSAVALQLRHENAATEIASALLNRRAA